MTATFKLAHRRLAPVLAALAMLAIGASAPAARAATPVPYQFDGLAFYQEGPPSDVFLGSPGGLPDTGWVRVTNNGTSTFTGTIGFHAIACTGIDFSDSFSVTLNPGDHYSFSFSHESSDFGGFNGLCNATQDGAEFFMDGTVSLGADTESVNLSIFDKDIHSNAPRTNPFGVTLDNYILQGGDPFGRDTGDDFEETQAPGPFQFAQVVAPPSDDQITANGTTISPTEGTSFSGEVASVSDPDPNATAAEYSATIDWGDGTTSAGTISGPIGGPFSVVGDHTYAEEGTYSVTVTITDVDTSTNTATADSSAEVGDAAIAATCVAPSAAGESFTGAVATVTDTNPSGTASDFTATIDWGDGSSSQGNVSGSTGGPFDVTGSHTYSSTGSFTVKTTVTDDGGSTDTTSCGLIVFGTSVGGNFVVADRNAAVGDQVTFWSGRWSRSNSPTGGPAPASFKGFEGAPTALPDCGAGGTWSTDTGSSPSPPVGPLPDYMAVIVSGSISQSGSVLSGDVRHVVVVHTAPGYAPDAGHVGSGEVVAQIC
jgi:hypothetical protein